MGEARRAHRRIRRPLGNCLWRNLSPDQMSARTTDPLTPPSIINRWLDTVYDGMTKMELRRGVGYRPPEEGRRARRHRIPARVARLARKPAGRRAGRHAEDGCDRGGSKSNTLRIPTLPHRPSRFQLHLPLRPKTAAAAGLGGLRAVLGVDDMHRMFRAAPTDKTSSSPKRTQSPRPWAKGRARRGYSTVARAAETRRGACESKQIELKKLLPKGRGLRLDCLSRADLALAMSHVNSEPKGALRFAPPAAIFRTMLEEVPLAELDLTPALIERTRAERGGRSMATGPIETYPHRSFN